MGDQAKRFRVPPGYEKFNFKNRSWPRVVLAEEYDKVLIDLDRAERDRDEWERVAHIESDWFGDARAQRNQVVRVAAKLAKSLVALLNHTGPEPEVVRQALAALTEHDKLPYPVKETDEGIRTESLERAGNR